MFQICLIIISNYVKIVQYRLEILVQQGQNELLDDENEGRLLGQSTLNHEHLVFFSSDKLTYKKINMEQVCAFSVVKTYNTKSFIYMMIVYCKLYNCVIYTIQTHLYSVLYISTQYEEFFIFYLLVKQSIFFQNHHKKKI